jgi:hypothetical protein
VLIAVLAQLLGFRAGRKTLAEAAAAAANKSV